MANNEHLLARGTAVGFSRDFTNALDVKYGPIIADLLLRTQADRLKITQAGKHLAMGADGAGWFQSLLINALTQQRVLVEGWVLAGESAVTDVLIGLIGQKNQVLATLLTGLKDKIVTQEKATTDAAIDALIAALQPAPTGGPVNIGPPSSVDTGGKVTIVRGN